MKKLIVEGEYHIRSRDGCGLSTSIGIISAPIEEILINQWGQKCVN